MEEQRSLTRSSPSIECFPHLFLISSRFPLLWRPNCIKQQNNRGKNEKTVQNGNENEENQNWKLDIVNLQKKKNDLMLWFVEFFNPSYKCDNNLEKYFIASNKL